MSVLHWCCREFRFGSFTLVFETERWGKVDIVLTPCGAYVVDILHSKSAESAAVIK
jgi:hypothetical protein